MLRDNLSLVTDVTSETTTTASRVTPDSATTMPPLPDTYELRRRLEYTALGFNLPKEKGDNDNIVVDEDDDDDDDSKQLL